MTGAKFQQTIERWKKIPTTYAEAELEAHLVTLMWQELGVDFTSLKSGAMVGTGLKPDYLVYQDTSQQPILVVEDKKRVPELANASDASFTEKCEKHCLYREAVSDFSGSPGNCKISRTSAPKSHPTSAGHSHELRQVKLIQPKPSARLR